MSGQSSARGDGGKSATSKSRAVSHLTQGANYAWLTHADGCLDRIYGISARSTCAGLRSVMPTPRHCGASV